MRPAYAHKRNTGMKKRMLLVALPLIAITSLLVTNCAREPRLKVPAIGETIYIKPIAINFTGTPKVENPAKAIRLDVMWGGRAINGKKNMTLKFYKNIGDSEPAFTKTWTELEDAYKTTGCSNEQIAALDGYLVGAALICDGSFKLDGIHFIQGEQDDGEKRSATSWSSYPVTEDITGFTFGLY